MKSLQTLSQRTWLFLLILAGWQALTSFRIVDPLFFPPLPALAATLKSLTLSGEAMRAIEKTLLRTSVGFSAGALGGIIAAAVLSSIGWLRRATQPVISALYSTPRLTLLPMVMLILGVNETSRIVLVAFGVFLLMLIQVSDAVRSVSEHYIDLAVNYGANQAMVIRKVYLPACLPQIFTALRLAFGRALVMTISVELLSCNDGLGSMIWNSWQTFATEKLYVSIALAAALGLTCQTLFRVLERRLVVWDDRRA
jgi:ABC-type nitrate/sulfonate/bicarbonate transport system permease component